MAVESGLRVAEALGGILEAGIWSPEATTTLVRARIWGSCTAAASGFGGTTRRRRPCTQGVRRRGHPWPATILGDFLLRGIGVPKDAAGGLAMYQRSCVAGDVVACGDLGRPLRGRRVRDRRIQPWATRLRTACDARSAHACGDLATLYHRGIGVPQDCGCLATLTLPGRYEQACRMIR